MKLSEIDKNLAVSTTIDSTGLVFLNAAEKPFRLYGIIAPDENYDYYRRMPPEIAEQVNDGVIGLNRNTAGGRVCFITNSSKIAIHVKEWEIAHFPHMPFSGVAGFDIFYNENGKELYAGTFMPPFNMTDGYDSFVTLPDDGVMRKITINMPLYSGVKELFIGLNESANVVSSPDYTYSCPIVYYGSSITQGGCASRPGNAYQSIISRELDSDFINLGFSGSARGESAMSDYISGLNMSAFVLDYDHNATNSEQLEKTHEPFYKAIREKNPTLPIVIVSRPQLRLFGDDKRRLEVITKTYENAIAAGDKNVYLVDGSKFFEGFAEECATVDNCHPNDFGFVCMAKGLLPILKNILEK